MNSTNLTRARKLFLRAVRQALASVDPNWARLNMQFNADGLTEAVLNGPRNGDVDVREVLTANARRQLSALRRRAVSEKRQRDSWLGNEDVTNEASVTLRNHAHKVEVLLHRTSLDFENCEDGYVSQISPDGAFTVERSESGPDSFTLARLARELQDDGFHCQTVCVRYYPLGLGEKRMSDGLEYARLRAAYHQGWILGEDGGSLEGMEYATDRERRRTEEGFRGGCERRELDALNERAREQGFADGVAGKPRAVLGWGSTEDTRWHVQNQYDGEYREGRRELTDPGRRAREQARFAEQASLVHEILPLFS